MVIGIDASQANRRIRSGTEWYAFHLIQEFKKLLADQKDLQVRLYTRGLLQPDLAADFPENFEVKILRWPLRYFWGQVRLSLEMLFNPPDILFCPAHTIPLIHPGSPLTLSRKGRGERRGGKTFATLHDVGFADYPELYDWKSRWYHRFSAKLAIKEAYHIFTVSEFSKERIIENYNSPSPSPSRGEGLRERVTVTYLGFDQSKFKPRDPRLAGDYILFVGRLEPKKNILNIIKAYEMAGMPQKLVLAGKKIDILDVESYLSTRTELASKIEFRGYVREEEKPSLYAEAAVFLFPTLYEGFGLPIIEAQASGVPVITSNTASNPEIAGEGALIVDPESPYEIAQAIRELMSNEDLREEKIRLGFENLKRFNWQQTARLTLQTMGILD